MLLSVATVSFPFLLLLNIIIGFIITMVIMPPIVEMVRESGFVRPNYKGDPIPVGVGFIFLITALVACTLSQLMLNLLGNNGLLFMLAISVITFLGLVDDALGSRAASGLKGHFKALLKGQLTTGALKALAGGLLAFLIALTGHISATFEWRVIALIVADTLIIALSINAVNLLDLRPGRACKGFILLAGIIIFIGWKNTNLMPLALLLGSVLRYISWDLKAQTMMGDTGSNALGIAIGTAAAWCFSDVAKICYLIFLIAFHIFTEKYSLTKVIAGNRLLNYLDKLGRD
ncbi:hypothetical protein V6C27_07685 [Peptococcaceae bacterium 1198_IL3148]